MGTVHAKSEPQSFWGDKGDGLFELNEPMELENETMMKPTIKLDGVRARVDRVHVDGLNRTKDDIIRGTVNELFHATDFEDVIIKAHKVRKALTSLGCFRDVGVFIDVSSGPAATPDGLEVTFQVKELSRIVGGVNTTVSENEGNVVFGVKLPNVAGRGERVQAEYSMGYRSSSNFSVTATKPLPHKPLSPVLSTSVYQQSHEYPWSGYRLLDRAVLLSLAFATSPNTKHTLQWEGMVRDTSVISKTTSFKVRENSGPQMKSILRHIVSIDFRDDALFPSRGAFLQFTSECGGLGGGVAQLRAELRAEGNVAPQAGLVIQVTGGLGVLHDMFGTTIADHFFLGGPTTLRGFKQRGAGPHSDGHAVGGKMYAAGGLHVYCGLPFISRRGLVSELMRSHFFVNVGCIPNEDEERSMAGLARGLRASVGAGLVARVGGAARLELNYCVPIRAQRGDATSPGLQFGLGAQFL